MIKRRTGPYIRKGWTMGSRCNGLSEFNIVFKEDSSNYGTVCLTIGFALVDDTASNIKIGSCIPTNIIPGENGMELRIWHSEIQGCHTMHIRSTPTRTSCPLGKVIDGSRIVVA